MEGIVAKRLALHCRLENRDLVFPGIGDVINAATSIDAQLTSKPMPPRTLAKRAREGPLAGLQRKSVAVERLRPVLLLAGHAIPDGSWTILTKLVVDKLASSQLVPVDPPSLSSSTSTPPAPCSTALVTVGHSRSCQAAKNLRLQQKVKSLKKKMSLMHKKNKRLEEENKELKKRRFTDGAAALAPLMLDGRDKRVGRLTPATGYQLAIVRNGSHIGTMGLVRSLNLSISRQTVERWERTMAHNLAVQSRCFHSACFPSIEDGYVDGMDGDAPPTGYAAAWLVCAVRGDALNAGMSKHKLKIHVCAVHSILKADDSINECKSTCDLQYEPLHCDASVLKSIYARHLKSVGVPAWSEPSAGTCSLRWYVFTTDQGGDEKACGRLIDEEANRDPTVLVSRMWCLDHVGHLIVGHLLSKTMWYWSGLATFCNIWRATGNARVIQQTWRHLFGDTAFCTAAFKRLPPRPLKGRWSAVINLEKWLVDAGGHREIPSALAKAPVSGSQRKRNSKPKPSKNAPEDVQSAVASETHLVAVDVEENAEDFVERRNRWLTHCLRCVRHADFWVQLWVGIKIRSPVEHYFSILKKLQATPRPANEKHAPILQLVSTEIGKVVSEMEVLFESHLYTSLWEDPVRERFECAWLDSGSLVFEDFMEDKLQLIVELLLASFVDFYRRVVVPMSQFPLRLFWYILSEPSVACPNRGRLCVDWLRGSGNHDATSFKLLRLFTNGIRESAQTGKACPALFELLSSVAKVWRFSTRDIEGKNNTLKWMAKLAPNMDLELMSSRLTVKGAFENCEDHRERSIRLAAIRDACVEHHDFAIATPPDPHRFVPISDIPEDALPIADVSDPSAGDVDPMDEPSVKIGFNAESGSNVEVDDPPVLPCWDYARLPPAESFDKLSPACASQAARIYKSVVRSMEVNDVDFVVPKCVVRGKYSQSVEKAFLIARKVGRNFYWLIEVSICDTDFGNGVQLVSPLRPVPWPQVVGHMVAESVCVSEVRWLTTSSAAIVNTVPVDVEPLRSRRSAAPCAGEADADAGLEEEFQQECAGEVGGDAPAEETSIEEMLGAVMEDFTFEADEIRSSLSFLRSQPDEVLREMERTAEGEGDDFSNDVGSSINELAHAAMELGVVLEEPPETASSIFSLRPRRQPNVDNAVAAWAGTVYALMEDIVLVSTISEPMLHCISLMESSSAAFVSLSWVCIDELKPESNSIIGRPIALDASNRIIYSRPSEKKTIAEPKFLMHTRDRMVRATGSMRMTVSEHSLRVASFFGVSFPVCTMDAPRKLSAFVHCAL